MGIDRSSTSLEPPSFWERSVRAATRVGVAGLVTAGAEQLCQSPEISCRDPGTGPQSVQIEQEPVGQEAQVTLASTESEALFHGQCSTML